MKNDFFNIVSDKEKIQNHIVFCGTFILVYEFFISSWKQGIFFLYSNCQTDISEASNKFYTDMPFRKMQFKDFEEQKNRLKHIEKKIEKDYKKLEKKYDYAGELMFLWMYEHGFITDKELDDLDKCRTRRNSYAHSLDQTLKKSIAGDDKKLLQSLVDITVGASQKWNDKVKRSSLSVRDAIMEMAKESGFETPVFQTNTDKFLSLVLENLKDTVYESNENADN